MRGRGNHGGGQAWVLGHLDSCGAGVRDLGIAWGTSMGCEGERCVRVGVVISQGLMSRCGQREGSCMGRHGWAGLVCIPTGACWRQHGRPTRQATSSGWAQTAGVPRSHLCCTWRRWLRALSLSSPRGCLSEVGPAGPGGALTAPTYHHCQRHP